MKSHSKHRLPDTAVEAHLPKTLKPQLATSVGKAPTGDHWIHEAKLDGYRMLCRIDHGRAQLISRNNHDWTDRFPTVATASQQLPLDSAFLDGELVVLDDRWMPDFGALVRGGGSANVTYFVFDIPFAEGHDLRKVPLLERKRVLEQVLASTTRSAPIRYCEHLFGNGPAIFKKARQIGLEGIISKRVNSPYVCRRSEDWLKIKCF